jgi:hypothetical protein
MIRMFHPHRDKLPVDGLILVLCYADEGSESADRLHALPSLAASERRRRSAASSPRRGSANLRRRPTCPRFAVAFTGRCGWRR